jgi:hypothetical protein
VEFYRPHDRRAHHRELGSVGGCGWGFGTEDGSEDDNVFTGNLAVGITSPTCDRGDERSNLTDPEWGINGSGFWFQAQRNIVTYNVAANTCHYGMSVWTNGGDTSQPLNTWEDNETIANGEDGVSVWNMLGGGNMVRQWSWHETRCIYMYPTGDATHSFTITDFTGRGQYGVTRNPTDSYPTCLWWGDYTQGKDSYVSGGDFQNYLSAMTLPLGCTAPENAYTCTMHINNPVFKGNLNDAFWVKRNVSTSWAEQDPMTVIITNATHIARLSGGYSFGHQWTHDDGVAGTTLSQMFVYDDNGNATDDFEIFATEQASTYMIPASTGPLTAGCYNDATMTGVSGLTNAQCLATYGYAVYGKVAPDDATTRSDVYGLVKAIPSARPSRRFRLRFQ